MRLTATDVAHNVLCVCAFGTQVSCAKMAEPTEMSLGADSCGSREPCIRWGQDRNMGRGNSGGCLAYRQKALAVSAAVYAARGIIQLSI